MMGLTTGKQGFYLLFPVESILNYGKSEDCFSCINTGLYIVILTHTLIIIIIIIMILTIIILPVVLYGCETWSLTLREDSRLRVFENRILRRIFGPKRDVNGEWRRLHNEELHNLYR